MQIEFVIEVQILFRNVYVYIMFMFILIVIYHFIRYTLNIFRLIGQSAIKLINYFISSVYIDVFVS